MLEDCWFKAARDGKIDNIKSPLKRGVKVERATEVSGQKSCTALSLAAFGGKNEIVKILLESGADVDKAGDNGVTRLWVASQEGKSEVVKSLVEEGKAEVDKAVVTDGVTPLYIAFHEDKLDVINC